MFIRIALSVYHSLQNVFSMHSMCKNCILTDISQSLLSVLSMLDLPLAFTQSIVMSLSPFCILWQLAFSLPSFCFQTTCSNYLRTITLPHRNCNGEVQILRGFIGVFQQCAEMVSTKIPKP